jgi:hypothetical protein
MNLKKEACHGTIIEVKFPKGTHSTSIQWVSGALFTEAKQLG